MYSSHDLTVTVTKSIFISECNLCWHLYFLLSDISRSRLSSIFSCQVVGLSFAETDTPRFFLPKRDSSSCWTTRTYMNRLALCPPRSFIHYQILHQPSWVHGARVWGKLLRSNLKESLRFLMWLGSVQWWLRGSTPKTFERDERDERERVLSSFIEGKFNPSKSPAPRTQPLARNLFVIARSTYYCSCRNYREARSFEGSSGITDPWRQSWFLIEDQPNWRRCHTAALAAT